MLPKSAGRSSLGRNYPIKLPSILNQVAKKQQKSYRALESRIADIELELNSLEGELKLCWKAIENLQATIAKFKGMDSSESWKC